MKQYLLSIITYKLRVLEAKEFERASNGLRVDLSLSLEELLFISKCIAKYKENSDE